MISVIQLAEADNEVGFGHIRELHAIGACLKGKGIQVNTYVLGTRPTGHPWASVRWVDDSETLKRLASNTDASVSIWSFRRRLDNHLDNLFAHHAGLRVWITDQPAEPLSAEMVVIPTITKCSLANWRGRVLQGLEYLPIESSYLEDPSPIRERHHDLLLSLGGADPTRTTLRLLPAIAEFDSTVVIGPGFVHGNEVERVANRLGIRHVKAPDGLHSLLRSHRIVVTAGGNTLGEAAASGTPALVTWEDFHERDQGEVFESLGAAAIVGQGVQIEPNLLKQIARKLLDSKESLTAMALAGRKAVDGCGTDRIVQAILEEVKK